MKTQFKDYEIEEIKNRLQWAETILIQWNKHAQDKEVNEAIHEIEKVLEIIKEN